MKKYIVNLGGKDLMGIKRSGVKNEKKMRQKAVMYESSVTKKKKTTKHDLNTTLYHLKHAKIDKYT